MPRSSVPGTMAPSLAMRWPFSPPDPPPAPSPTRLASASAAPTRHPRARATRMRMHRRAGGSRELCAPPRFSKLDSPARAVPVGIAQLALEDLAGIFARQVAADLNDARHLVIGEVAAQVGAHVLRVQSAARLGLNNRHQLLAELGVGDTEHGAVLHAGGSMQHRFDFRRIDVDPARDHHVALAVAHKQIAVLVEVANVT